MAKWNSKTYDAIGIACLMVVLILELLPLGAVMIVAAGPGEHIKRTFSYFDLTLAGNADFAPIITGIFTVAAILLSIITLFRSEQAEICKMAAVVCKVIAVISSLAPLLFFGHRWMTLTSYAISVMLAVSVYFQAAANDKR